MMLLLISPSKKHRNAHASAAVVSLFIVKIAQDRNVPKLLSNNYESFRAF